MSGSWQGAGFGATGNATIVGQEEVGHVRRPEVPRSRRSPAHFRYVRILANIRTSKSLSPVHSV